MDSANRKKLVASAVLIVASIALLVGLTFAWFTDSATSKGNKIQAGTLGITATKADVGAGGPSYTLAGLNGGQPISFSSTAADIEGGGPIISEDSWEPGQSNAKLLTVKNDGNLAAKVKLQFDVLDGGLEGALWFDFVQVANDGTVTGQFEKRPMGTLSALADQREFHLAGGDSISFILAYGMSESAGNEYQGGTFEATVSILATQDAVEADGFGNKDYDEDADYPTVVTSADELVAMAATGGSIELGADVGLAESTTFAADTTLNLNGKTLTVGDGAQSIKSAVGTTLVIEGDGLVKGAVATDKVMMKSGNLVINAGDNFSIQSNGGYAVYGDIGSTVLINGGTYSASSQGRGVIARVGNGGSLFVSDATVTVEVPSVFSSGGISSSASETVLENVNVYAGHSIALDLNNQYGSAKVTGGSFVTDKRIDLVNPTIRYQGTLDISNASITRIGTGILFSRSYPAPTMVDGLQQSNLSFIKAQEDCEGEEIDYRH